MVANDQQNVGRPVSYQKNFNKGIKLQKNKLRLRWLGLRARDKSWIRRQWSSWVTEETKSCITRTGTSYQSIGINLKQDLHSSFWRNAESTFWKVLNEFHTREISDLRETWGIEAAGKGHSRIKCTQLPLYSDTEVLCSASSFREERAASKDEASHGGRKGHCHQPVMLILHVAACGGLKSEVLCLLFLHGNPQTQPQTDKNEVLERFPNFLQNVTKYAHWIETDSWPFDWSSFSMPRCTIAQYFLTWATGNPEYAFPYETKHTHKQLLH